MTVIEVTSPLDKVNLFGDTIRQQPEYFVLTDYHVLQVLTVLLRTLPDLIEQLREGRGQ
jgi:hypothetical protein